MDGNFGWWFAGLTDGEGCFDIHPVGDYFICRFTIGLRADDLDVLTDLQEATGLGAVRVQAMRNGACPQARWEIAKKSEVVRLAALFEDYPLRSKKARDLAIWKQAVEVWASAKRGSRWHGRSPHTATLRDLREQLRATRSYSVSPVSARR